MTEKPLLIVAVGLPGSGKSTYFQRIGANPVSTDAIRQQLADDASDQTIHKQVFETLRFLVRQRVRLGRTVTYIDATNLTVKDRNQYIRMARLWKCRIQALYFDTPVELCLERNRNRERFVPEDVIAKMAAKLVPPHTREGFESVSVVTP
jgi:predicted kinase